LKENNIRSIAIYYISGTGNTEIVANMIKEEFIKHLFIVDLIRIEDVLKNKQKIDLKKYDFIGIGSQIIGYGAPHIVKDFIKILEDGVGRKVFIFRTAGGVAPVNYNASKPIIRKLKRKGYDVFYERIFSISSNWIVKFDDNVIQQLYEATRRKVGIMCQEMILGERRNLKTGIGLKLLMEFLMLILPTAFRLVGKDYKVNKTCNLCELCVKNCPVRNIYKKDDKIKFKFSCNSCMRCVYQCPQKAINFKRLTFFPVSGGYNIKKILETSCTTSRNENSATPPFFHNYIELDNL
jgi:flavodoxin/ferredoxin